MHWSVRGEAKTLCSSLKTPIYLKPACDTRNHHAVDKFISTATVAKESVK